MTAAREWRRPLLRSLDLVLLVFDLVLSVVFLVVALVTGNVYFRGVGVGLTIAWATAAVAILYRRYADVTA